MSLAGGFYRIGAPQIKTLPIAIPADETLDKVEIYVEELEKLYSQDYAENNRQKELLELIDKEIYSAYGLNSQEIECVKNYINNDGGLNNG